MKILRPLTVLAAFFLLTPAGHAADAAAGKALAEDGCADCHGDDGKGDADFPDITSLSAADFAKAMQEYADGTRSESPKMTKVAKKLSAEQIADLAAYYATLK